MRNRAPLVVCVLVIFVVLSTSFMLSIDESEDSDGGINGTWHPVSSIGYASTGAEIDIPAPYDKDFVVTIVRDYTFQGLFGGYNITGSFVNGELMIYFRLYETEMVFRATMEDSNTLRAALYLGSDGVANAFSIIYTKDGSHAEDGQICDYEGLTMKLDEGYRVIDFDTVVDAVSGYDLYFKIIKQKGNVLFGSFDNVQNGVVGTAYYAGVILEDSAGIARLYVIGGDNYFMWNVSVIMDRCVVIQSTTFNDIMNTTAAHTYVGYSGEPDRGLLDNYDMYDLTSKVYDSPASSHILSTGDLIIYNYDLKVIYSENQYLGATCMSLKLDDKYYPGATVALITGDGEYTTETKFLGPNGEYRRNINYINDDGSIITIYTECFNGASDTSVTILTPYASDFVGSWENQSSLVYDMEGNHAENVTLPTGILEIGYDAGGNVVGNLGGHLFSGSYTEGGVLEFGSANNIRDAYFRGYLVDGALVGCLVFTLTENGSSTDYIASVVYTKDRTSGHTDTYPDLVGLNLPCSSYTISIGDDRYSGSNPEYRIKIVEQNASVLTVEMDTRIGPATVDTHTYYAVMLRTIDGGITAVMTGEDGYVWNLYISEDRDYINATVSPTDPQAMTAVYWFGEGYTEDFSLFSYASWTSDSNLYTDVADHVDVGNGSISLRTTEIYGSIVFGMLTLPGETLDVSGVMGINGSGEYSLILGGGGGKDAIYMTCSADGDYIIHVCRNSGNEVAYTITAYMDKHIPSMEGEWHLYAGTILSDGEFITIGPGDPTGGLSDPFSIAWQNGNIIGFDISGHTVPMVYIDGYYSYVGQRDGTTIVIDGYLYDEQTMFICALYQEGDQLSIGRVLYTLYDNTYVEPKIYEDMMQYDYGFRSYESVIGSKYSLMESSKVSSFTFTEQRKALFRADVTLYGKTGFYDVEFIGVMSGPTLTEGYAWSSEGRLYMLYFSDDYKTVKVGSFVADSESEGGYRSDLFTYSLEQPKEIARSNLTDKYFAADDVKSISSDGTQKISSSSFIWNIDTQAGDLLAGNTIHNGNSARTYSIMNDSQSRTFILSAILMDNGIEYTFNYTEMETGKQIIMHNIDLGGDLTAYTYTPTEYKVFEDISGEWYLADSYKIDGKGDYYRGYRESQNNDLIIRMAEDSKMFSGTLFGDPLIGIIENNGITMVAQIDGSSVQLNGRVSDSGGITFELFLKDDNGVSAEALIFTKDGSTPYLQWGDSVGTYYMVYSETMTDSGLEFMHEGSLYTLTIDQQERVIVSGYFTETADGVSIKTDFRGVMYDVSPTDLGYFLNLVTEDGTIWDFTLSDGRVTLVSAYKGLNSPMAVYSEFGQPSPSDYNMAGEVLTAVTIEVLLGTTLYDLTDTAEAEIINIVQSDELGGNGMTLSGLSISHGFGFFDSGKVIAVATNTVSYPFTSDLFFIVESEDRSVSYGIGVMSKDNDNIITLDTYQFAGENLEALIHLKFHYASESKLVV